MKKPLNAILQGLGLLMMTAFISGPVVADDVSHSEARMLRESGKILPLETIIEKAKAYRKGEVIDTELERDDGMLVYEIEILDEQGRVWELEFDATNGDLLELELDD
ncbi:MULTISPECIES: PepSY domain-containing protein [unclassified Methylophaga]|uniref:PepSY domain-containing protein n=1 Tax=unclassified Methylophaga TaxID=2629249 RepID=UPI000C8DD1FB|nr:MULTISPECIES: PepSY domain-containing protein [unclassified Methylophaga]MAK66088.1 peptidase [Methylophaga sp.]MAK68263.1 peptidase [Methylophaga sp.]MAY17284.1 peptidase [Methylophaga sp.]MBN45714.1 peptidase [Methylophaga sp.]HAO24626.1 peptidase [Methylophaga sp.]